MTLISEHVETDTRERILVVAERLFRQIGYQKTTVADIAKELRMSPANVYRFFDSKKSIHEGVARTLMGEVEVEARRIAARPGPAKPRLREMLKTINRMNTERYVGDSKLHEMVEIAMQEDWDVCVAHIECIAGDHRPGDRAGRGLRRVRGPRPAAGVALHLHRHDPLLPPADDRAGANKPGATIDQMIDFLIRAFERAQGELNVIHSLTLPSFRGDAKR